MGWLAIGDAVVTVHGAVRPVVWIGRRWIDCRRHAAPRRGRPVRVRAHAFGAAVPGRDLLLSPDHAVFVEDVLVPVRCLIDGAGVVQERVGEIEYFYVELDAHDVMLAEGLPAESYLDTGNRADFGNGGGAVRLHPEFSGRAAAAAAWREARSCVPIVVYGCEFRRKKDSDSEARRTLIPTEAVQ
jgi:hypothetical protein